MSLEVLNDAGTERVKDEVAQAVKAGLGPRLETGSWRVTLRKLPGGFVVDLTNLDGIMRQWIFDRNDPIAETIRRDLLSRS
jgi:hypothetical protein